MLLVWRAKMITAAAISARRQPTAVGGRRPAQMPVAPPPQQRGRGQHTGDHHARTDPARPHRRDPWPPLIQFGATAEVTCSTTLMRASVSATKRSHSRVPSTDPLGGQRQRRLERGAIHPAQRPAAPRAGRQRWLPSSARRALTKSTNAASCTDTGASASSTTPIFGDPGDHRHQHPVRFRAGRCWAVTGLSPLPLDRHALSAPAVGNPSASSAASSINANWVRLRRAGKSSVSASRRCGIPRDRLDRAHPRPHRLGDMGDERLIRAVSGCR